MEKIVWNTEHRQHMRELATGGPGEWYRLNRFLIYIISSEVLFNILLAGFVWVDNLPQDISLMGRVLVTFFGVASAIGGYLVLRLNKIGVYIFLGVRILLFLLLMVHPFGGLGRGDSWGILAECVFLAGCLLLNNRCKINAYDLLWARDDVLRPCDYLESIAPDPDKKVFTKYDMHLAIRIVMHVIIWVNYLGLALPLLDILYDLMVGNGTQWIYTAVECVSFVLTCAAITGAYLVLDVRKTGYYLLMGACALNWLLTWVMALLTGVADITVAVFFLWSDIVKMAVVSFVLKLRKNGLSGYDILWKRLTI